MMKRVMILGAGIMQIPAIETAKKLGWLTLCVDKDSQAPAVGLCDHFLPIDLKDRVELAKIAGVYKEKYGLDGVITVGTDFSPSVAWIAEQNGLPGIGYQKALDASDKIRMRARFQEAGVNSPRFVEMSPEQGPLSPLDTLDFPLVVKPVDNMGARGVRRVDKEAELIQAIGEAIGFSRSQRAIVEEYLEGPEYSIDALVYKGEIEIYGIADRHIYFPPCFIEMGHTLPSVVPPEVYSQIIDQFKEGIKALGIDNGAAKGDIKFARGKAWIGEIAARLSGGFMSGWTYPYAAERSAIEGALKLCVGEDPCFSLKESSLVSAERAFISIPGKIRKIENLDEAHKFQLVRDIFVLKDEGDEVDFPRNNVEKVGNVIACGKLREKTCAAAEKAAREIVVILEPAFERTAVFLNNKESFPPPAFSVDSEIMREWEKEWGKPDFLNIPFTKIDFPLPHKSLTSQNPVDWQKRPLSDVFKIVKKEYKLGKGKNNQFSFYFWTALLKGSLQGARWFLDTVKGKNND
jgi:biotin carboxylase